MRSVSRTGRIAAIGAVVVAIVLAAYILMGANTYTVTAEFENAGQVIKGNQVKIGGISAGKVTDVQLAPNGHVLISMEVSGPHVPLKMGTRAEIRQLSLSSIVGRYIDLTPPTETAALRANRDIPNGGFIPITQTITAVDLDEVFDTFDPVARVAVQDFIKGSANEWRNHGPEANRGFQYLNPALSTSRRLFAELASDKPLLRSFILDSAKFMGTVAQRREELSGLITNLNTTMGAIGSQRAALREAIGRFPDFMRNANTTFVNLRSTLDTLDPLVNASKPVAPKLQRLLVDLRPFAHDARPTVNDLNNIVRRPGPSNDLVELDRTFPPMADIALNTENRSVAPGNHDVSVGRVRGAFPEMSEALTRSIQGSDGPGGQLGPIPTFRPYTPDLFGWFDDFSTTGVYDALGGASRTQVYTNFLDRTGLQKAIAPSSLPALESVLKGVPGGSSLLAQGGISKLLGKTPVLNPNGTRTGQYKRCPGGAEVRAPDGSNVFSASQRAALDCRESDRATGP